MNDIKLRPGTPIYDEFQRFDIEKEDAKGMSKAEYA